MNQDVQARFHQCLAERKPLLAALNAFTLFLGGGLIGALLAGWVAPGSGVAAAVSLLALPGAFMLSLLLWQGFTFFVAILRLLRYRRRVDKGTSVFEALARKAWILVPVPVIFCSFAGIVVGIVGDTGFIKTVFLYVLLGSVYGWICYALGRTGRLPLIDE